MTDESSTTTEYWSKYDFLSSPGC